jgi:hypothetical protein
MANEVNQAPVRRFTWVNPAGSGIAGTAGMTADEVKLHQVQPSRVSRPDVAPIAQRGPVEFIAPTTSSESLRLAVPEAANPFATPTGPRHDHMMVRKALTRSGTDISRQLVQSLKTPPAGLAKEDADRMRASLSREHAMLGLLEKLQKMQDQIYGRIIGTQEA